MKENDVDNKIDAPSIGSAGKGATMDGVAGVVTGATVGTVAGPATMTGTAAGAVAGAVITDAAVYVNENDPTVSKYDDAVADPHADQDIDEVRGMGNKVADFVKTHNSLI